MTGAASATFGVAGSSSVTSIAGPTISRPDGSVAAPTSTPITAACSAAEPIRLLADHVRIAAPLGPSQPAARGVAMKPRRGRPTWRSTNNSAAAEALIPATRAIVSMP